MDYKEYQRLIALGFLPGLRDTDPSQYQYKALDNLAKEHTDLRVPITLNVSSNNIITNVTTVEWQAKRTLVPFAIRFSDLDADYIMNYKSGYYLYSIFTSSFRRDFKISVQNSLVVQNVKDTYYPETFVFNVGEGTADGDTFTYKVTTDLNAIKSCIAAAKARKGNQRIVVNTPDGRFCEFSLVYPRTDSLWASTSFGDTGYALSLSSTEDESTLTVQTGIIDLSDYYTKEETNTKLSGYVLKENIKDLAPADEEDLTLYTKADSSKVIRLKDRDTTNGMGYKILRLPEDKILTQDMINEANTIYEIRYDFDLNGATITVPEGCTLKFEGGSLKNGSMILNKTLIQADNCPIFDLGSISGFSIGAAKVAWFGAIPSESPLKKDQSTFIQKALDSCFQSLSFEDGYYYVSTTLNVNNPKNICLSGRHNSPLVEKRNNSLQKSPLSSVIWSDVDITLIAVNIGSDIYTDTTNNSVPIVNFHLMGGAFDVSQCASYTSSTCVISLNKSINLFPHIETTFIGPVNEANIGNYTNTNSAIEVVQSTSGFGSMYNGRFESLIEYYHTAYKQSVKLSSNNLPFITNVEHHNQIYKCKISYDLGESGNNGGLISGWVQPHTFGDSESDVCLKGRLSGCFIDTKFWDLGYENTPKYAFRVLTPDAAPYIGNNINCKKEIDGYQYLLGLKYQSFDLLSSPLVAFPFNYTIPLLTNVLYGYRGDNISYEISGDDLQINLTGLTDVGCTITKKATTIADSSSVTINITDLESFTGVRKVNVLLPSNTVGGNSDSAQFITTNVTTSSGEVYTKNYVNSDSDGKQFSGTKFVYIATLFIQPPSSSVKSIQVRLSGFTNYYPEVKTIGPIVLECHSNYPLFPQLQTRSIKVDSNYDVILHGASLHFEKEGYLSKTTEAAGESIVKFTNKTLFKSIQEAIEWCSNHKSLDGTACSCLLGSKVITLYYIGSSNYLVDATGNKWYNQDVSLNYGPTDNRPAKNVWEGFKYFDTTLSSLVVWNGTSWVDAIDTSNKQDKPTVETLIDAQTVSISGESSKLYSGASLTSLTITAAKTDNSQNGAEEVFQFSTGTTTPTITITGVSWANGDTPTFAASKTYEIHIMYNSTLDKFLATYATYD